jgi:hypothetical protein
VPSSFAATLTGGRAHPRRQQTLLFQPAKRDVHRGRSDFATGTSRDFVDDRNAIDILPEMEDGEQDHLLELAKGIAHQSARPGCVEENIQR